MTSKKITVLVGMIAISTGVALGISYDAKCQSLPPENTSGRGCNKPTKQNDEVTVKELAVALKSGAEQKDDEVRVLWPVCDDGYDGCQVTCTSGGNGYWYIILANGSDLCHVPGAPVCSDADCHIWWYSGPGGCVNYYNQSTVTKKVCP